jgi:PHS family inorganic phosphate transporter-like MFS transporter
VKNCRLHFAFEVPLPPSANPRLPHVLEIYALFMLLGIFTTLCIPETARITLEVLSGEDSRSLSTANGGELKDENMKGPEVEAKSV